MPLFGKSVASRYNEAAAKIGPSGVAEIVDPITWAALLLAVEEWKKAYLTRISFARQAEVAQQVSENEAFRLVNDGYILGRIENRSEGKAISFSGIADGDPSYEAGEFAFVAAQAIAAGCSDGSFTGPPPSDILKLLNQFALDAGRPLDEYLAENDDNFRLVGVANACAANLGRQVALIEDVYVSPKKRRELLAIREKHEADGLRHFNDIKSELQESGIQTPGDWAAQMMRKVRDEIKL